MKITVSDKMIIGLLRAWATRNLANEGMKIVSFNWKNGSLEIELVEDDEQLEE
ncbi:MAG: hypothetical protein RLZ75_734 [Pseudomonadota bacterium]|jgi:Holliday junction resolvase-like predicted endonuclease